MSILDIMDELARGRRFVRAAYMAAHGANGLDSAERNAMAELLGAAENTLESVEASLEALQRPSETGQSTDAESGV
jgi:hypothetical protein